MKQRVLIAGGGVAALEAALVLRELAEARVSVELVAPEPHFWYRPLSVAEPFDLGETNHYELGALAAAAGATFTLGTLHGVDAPRHEASTSVGDISYDHLLVAVGASPTEAVPGALTFRGPADTDAIRALLREIEAGEVRRLAFAVPWGAVWSLPIYELALMTAAHLAARRVEGVELTLVTPEEEPLQVFGQAGTEAVAELLREHEITLVAGSHPAELTDGSLRLVPDARIAVDRVVALPRLRGARLDGLPQTVSGFIPVDAHGRVRGVDDVYAAGDIANFPVKQGGIAAQLADAAAESIAQAAGVDIQPEPFRPLLRGLLLTGGRPRFLRHELAAPAGDAAASPDPLWWPPAKIVGRRFAPFIAELSGAASTPEPLAPPGAIPIDVELDPGEMGRLAAPRLEDVDGEGDTVAKAMSPDPLVVSPDDVLAEVAQRMRDGDAAAAAVTAEGELIGVLTSRDLLRAFAARVPQTRARVREWMTSEPIAVPASIDVGVALGLMKEHGIDHLLVVEGKRPIGVLGIRQAARRPPARLVGLGF